MFKKTSEFISRHSKAESQFRAEMVFKTISILVGSSCVHFFTYS